ncbi:MAG: YajQ family cyclic di-GMP-binding protein [Acidobacteriota bacterium]|nr:YajQ family cyclic di-GMP-binding protein [Acidobacteriota bacterium]
MPSFDVVSEVNMQEVKNAVNQATREVETRFDFKGTNARFSLDDAAVTMRAPDKFQLGQMYDILTAKLSARKVNVKCLERESPQENVSDAWQVVKIRQGIETDLARDLVKMVKQTKLKVQVAVQGQQLRVSGKKRDVLQEVIGLLKEAKIDLPLQFINFRE